MPEPTRAETLHDEYRKKVWEDSKSGSENFDKYLITFSTGALTLSLTFIKDVVPLKDAVWIPLLIASWASFLFAILVTLISFRVSLLALERMVPVLDDFYLKGNAEAFNKHLEDPWTKLVDVCAYTGIFFFVVGLLCTMIFVSVNVVRANGTAEKDTPPQDNSIHIDRMDVCCNSKEMTQNTKTEGHGKDKIEKGVKPQPMTPARPTPYPPQPCPAQPLEK